LRAGESQPAERFLVQVVTRDCAGHDDGGRDDTGEGGDCCEYPEREGQYMDRVPGALGFDREALHVEIG